MHVRDMRPQTCHQAHHSSSGCRNCGWDARFSDISPVDVFDAPRPTPGTWLVHVGLVSVRQGLLLRVSAGGRTRQVQHAGGGRYREVQRCVRCGCGIWGEQESVLPVRLVPVQDVSRAPTPDVARLPAAGRHGRPPDPSSTSWVAGVWYQWWAGDCSG